MPGRPRDAHGGKMAPARGVDLLLIVESRKDADGVVRLAVAGEIDMVSVGDLRAVFPGVLADRGVTGIEVDFAEVSFCDSAGIRTLDEAYAMAAQRGVWFRLVNLRPSVRRVFEIVGVLEALTRPAPRPGPDGRS